MVYSPAELRAVAGRWDDLWRRSLATHPTVLAEPLAVYLETFHAAAGFSAIVLRDKDRFVAALPLLRRRKAGLRAGTLPNNEWALCGDLMIDQAADHPLLVARLVDALAELPCRLLWFDGTQPQRADWKQLGRELRSRRFAVYGQEMFQVGVVDIPHDWEAYFASRSRNHRRQIRRTADRLSSLGGGVLKVYSEVSPQEVERLLRRGFEVESRGWKSRDGNCVIKQPEIFEFHVRHAQALAASGHLQLLFLEHAGRAIAFEYGLLGKGHYFSPKVGYDEEFAECSPGQQLRAQFIEQCRSDPETCAIDFHGPLTAATAKWATRSYPLGRMICALRGPTSRAIVEGNRWLRPVYKAIRTKLRKHDEGEVALRPYVELKPPDEAEARETELTEIAS